MMHKRMLGHLFLVLILWLHQPVSAFSPKGNTIPDLKWVSQLGGSKIALAIANDFIFIGVGPRLVILNVSNPVNPVFVSQTSPLPGVIRAISISGNIAYVATVQAGGVWLIDISNPEHPIEVSHFAVDEGCYSVAILGQYIYLGSLYQIYILNRSNPFNLIKEGQFDVSADKIVISGGYAFVATGNYLGLYVLDISVPNQPRQVAVVNNLGGWAEDVTVAGSFAYIASGYSGVYIVNISNPTNPVLVSNNNTSGYANGVAAKSVYVFVADSTQGLKVINVANPSAPTQVGASTPLSASINLIVLGDYVYIADNDQGLQIVNISNPARPIEASRYTTFGAPYAIYMNGNYVYTMNFPKVGMEIVNINSPSAPTSVAFLNTTNDGQIAINGNFAYIANGTSGLLVVDIHDPRHPVSIATLDTPNQAEGVAVSGSYAYVADRDSFRVINVSDPAHPYEVGACAINGYIDRVMITGNWAYAFGGGLYAINIASPGQPQPASNLEWSGTVYEVDVSGGTAYVTTYGELIFVDVSDPTHMVQIGQTFPVENLTGSDMVGHYMFLARGFDGISVIDVSDIYSPQEIAWIDTPGHAEDILVAGPYVFVADATGGLLTLYFVGWHVIMLPLVMR